MTQATTLPWKSALQYQFVATLDMLENAMRACPEQVWEDAGVPIQHRFWYLAYHTLFWTDVYLGENEESFTPQAPFDRGELEPAGVYPERTYGKPELLGYLAHVRDKLAQSLAVLDEPRAAQPCGFRSGTMSVFELQLYSMRHVQHHAAQLNLLLRQRTDSAPPKWVGRGKVAAASA